LNGNNFLLSFRFSRYILVVLYGIYLLLIGIGIYFHEPWRDEAQDWLLARDLSLAQLLNQMPYEGTPALWHLLLVPLAKSGLPYYSKNILHGLIAASTAYLLLFRSPFSVLLKAMILFSYYFLIEYSLIARNYNLSMLFLFLIAAYYPQRHEQKNTYFLLLFLLLQTNIHSFGFAIAFFVIFSIEQIQNNPSVYLPKTYRDISKLYGELFFIFGMIVLLYQLLPIHKVPTPLVYDAADRLIFWKNAFVKSLFYPYISVYLLIIWVPILFLYTRSISAIIFLIIVFSCLSFLFIFIHKGYERHHGFLFISLIVAYWIVLIDTNNHSLDYYIDKLVSKISFNKPILYKLNAKNINKMIYRISVYSFYISILFLNGTAYTNYRKEILFQYSGSKEMAYLIAQQHLEGFEWAAYPSYTASALLPYFPQKKIFYLDREEYGTFMIWDTKFQENAFHLSQKEIIKRFERQFVNSPSPILILNKPLDPSFLHRYQLILQTKGFVFKQIDEIYFLYRRK
jgi:hypothetical protein